MSTKIKSLQKLVCILLTAAMIFPCFAIRVRAVGGMTVGQDCIDLIKSTEGFSKYKYWDYGQWSIGYGSGCGADEYPDGITEEEAEQLLRKYAEAFADYVNSFAVKYDIELTQNQFDALVCICYALGNLWDAYGDFDLKTILINGSENYSFLEIAQAFGEWRVAGGQVLQGLVRRRHLETVLFLKNRTDYTSEVWRVTDESGVNLRKSPDVSSEKTGYMVLNTIFAITDTYTDANGTVWGKTDYEGTQQWCSLDYCLYMVGGPLGYDGPLPTEEPTDNPGSSSITSVSEKWKINSSDGVKLRSGPGLNYNQIGLIPDKTEITVTATADADGYHWGRTSYNGTSGWCTLDYAVKTDQQQEQPSGEVPRSIYISQKPTKVVYNEGEQLDLTGMIVKAVYSDGSEKVITDYDTSGFESVEGTHFVKVSYMEKTASFNVTVNGKEVTGIRIESPPDKIIYKLGEGLSIKGLKVTAVYTNNTSGELKKFYLENVDGFSKTPGKTKIKVAAGNCEAEFEVEVTEKTLIGIEVTSLPDITDYVLGQQFSREGLIVHALFDNGTKNIVSDYTINGYDPSQLGEQTVTIKYGGFSDSFKVNVTEPDIYELPGDLDGNGARDIFDLVLLNKYLDGSGEISAQRLCLTDINQDGYVNGKDVEALSRIVSEQ
ncbi:MAG: bacterial Ig-like domain-containing protein [Porcipelethomonas sp.]